MLFSPQNAFDVLRNRKSVKDSSIWNLKQNNGGLECKNRNNEPHCNGPGSLAQLFKAGCIESNSIRVSQLKSIELLFPAYYL
ncbi:MAG: hypothetical protein NVS3B19_13220 [Ginsengibacter sp.]